MNCHNQVLKDDPRLAVVRESAATGSPIPWVQIHKLPDYVYFNHSVHVNRGVSCVECHGQINQMDEVYHAKPLSMSFCLDCHRDPATRLRPLDKITDLDWKAAGCRRSNWQWAKDSFTTGMCSRCKIVRPVIDENDSTYLSRTGDWPEVLAQSGSTGRHAGIPPVGGTRISRRAPANGPIRFPAAISSRSCRPRSCWPGLGATGCRRPVENIYPFAKMPENYVHGVPQYFATAMPTRRTAHSAGRQIQRRPARPKSRATRSSRTATAARTTWPRPRC